MYICIYTLLNDSITGGRVWRGHPELLCVCSSMCQAHTCPTPSLILISAPRLAWVIPRGPARFQVHVQLTRGHLAAAREDSIVNADVFISPGAFPMALSSDRSL